MTTTEGTPTPTLISRDFADTELLRVNAPPRGRARYETFDKHFQARRHAKRGWELIDTRSDLTYSCDSFEICQVRVVELLILEYLRPLVVNTDPAVVRDRLTHLTNTLTRHT